MSADLPRLPKDFPYRMVEVPGWSPFRVPRYIVRIDIDNGGAGTHGWQVRYGERTVFFGDSTSGRFRSPRTSLQRATRHLATVYAGPPIRRPERELRGKNIKTGFRGIRLHRSKKAGRNFAELYMEVGAIVHGQSAQRIYVGTENTVTPARLNAALRKALALRRQLELNHWGESTIRQIDIRRAKWTGIGSE